MSSLILLRHGQAMFGGDDYDRLSELGERQARATGAFLAARGMRFDRVLVGPRRRHRQSAEAVLAAWPEPVKIEIEPALDEFADGGALLVSARQRHAASGGSWPKTRSEQLALYLREIQYWSAGSPIPGCRPAAEFYAVVGNWLRRLQTEHGPGQRLLAVTSAGTIAALICQVLELPPARIFDFIQAMHNAALSEIVFSGGRASVRSFNSAGHLPVELVSFI